MPALIADTHAHLTDYALDEIEFVVQRAAAAGVGRILAVGIDLETSAASISLARRFPIVYAAVGVHPQTADQFSTEALAEIRRLASDPKVVAIGEIGLDYYRCQVPISRQMTAFQEQLALAAELSLPVVIHDREAHDDVRNLIGEIQHGPDLIGRAGVLHCFSGDFALATTGIARGFFISFAGNVTYRRSAELRAVAAQLPFDSLLSETDSPYLAPEPRRGRPNEPANVRFVVESLSQSRGASVESVAAQTYANAQRLFGWS
ncbi:MAG TPA: TatD family hydrolase [Chloroflexota bacterium]|nr:TatD family hydrolase [Chloroflexota bacterium]